MEIKTCKNPACRADNPVGAKFCRKCGTPFLNSVRFVTVDEDLRPFHIRYKEYNLIPYSEHPANFFFNQPDYIEKEYLPHGQDQFLWIVKDGKFGITTYRYDDHWYGDEVIANRIIKCEYDCIEKADGYFICHKGSRVTYIDLQGNKLK